MSEKKRKRELEQARERAEAEQGVCGGGHPHVKLVSLGDGSKMVIPNPDLAMMDTTGQVIFHREKEIFVEIDKVERRLQRWVDGLQSLNDRFLAMEKNIHALFEESQRLSNRLLEERDLRNVWTAVADDKAKKSEERMGNLETAIRVLQDRLGSHLVEQNARLKRLEERGDGVVLAASAGSDAVEASREELDAALRRGGHNDEQ